MRNIPDYVQQIQEIERNLKAFIAAASNEWKDEVAERFSEKVFAPYCDCFACYVTGAGLTGLGLDNLLKQMDKHLSDMSSLSGLDEDVAFMGAAFPQHNGIVNNWADKPIDVENLDKVIDRGGIVHNENRDRDYWENEHGTKPGELNKDDIVDFFDNKPLKQ